MVAKLKHKSASVTLRPVEGNVVWLANLYAEERKQGHARELMTEVITKADAQGIVLQLDARAYGHPSGMGNGDLILFYESFGFRKVESDITKNLMERQPQGSQEIHPL